MDKISVVIPAYNAEKKIGRCVNSILNQEYSNLEIICVNDGSKANTLNVLNELSESDKRIKVIDQKNKGEFMARKAGIMQATGKFMMFIDADDEFINKHAFSKLISIINSQNDVQIVQFGSKWQIKSFIFRNHKTKKLGLTSAEDLRYKYYKDFIGMAQSEVISVTAWGKLYLTELVVDAISDIDNRSKMGDDLLLNLHVIFSDKFHNLYTCDEVFYKYYSGGISGTVDVSVLDEYGRLKKDQNEICNKWNLPEDALIYCNGETVYFLLACVYDMIDKQYKKDDIIQAVSKANNYECVKIAKNYFQTMKNQSKLWDGLKFISSDCSAEEYYEYALKNKPKPTLKTRIRKTLHI